MEGEKSSGRSFEVWVGVRRGGGVVDDEGIVFESR